MDDWRLRGQEAWLQDESFYRVDFPAFWLRAYAEKNAFYRLIADEARRFVAQMGRGQEDLEGDKVRHFWHEHCEFCWEKVTCDTDASFYCTGNLRYWICPACYRDFKERFGWAEKDASALFDPDPGKEADT